jgi:hypothetical protein
MKLLPPEQSHLVFDGLHLSDCFKLGLAHVGEFAEKLAAEHEWPIQIFGKRSSGRTDARA